MSLRPWLRPGIGVKRWLGVAFVGLMALALAGALALRQLYREVDVDGPVQALLYVESATGATGGGSPEGSSGRLVPA